MVSPERTRAATSEQLLLTVREAAALMRIGRDTAYALVAEGRIPSIRLGRQIRIPRAALIRHLEEEAIRQEFGSERKTKGGIT